MRLKKIWLLLRRIIYQCIYNARPEQFFTFYRNEMLNFAPQLTSSGPAMAQLEKNGHLHCIITSNIYDIPRRGGCQNVINLHGTIYENQCPRCKRNYPLEYIKILSVQFLSVKM